MRDQQPMRASSAYACFLVLLALILPLPAAFGKPQEPEHPETKQLVALVTKAAALVKSQGEAAFPAFRTKGSEWFHGDTYLFVLDTNGMQVCHPVRPDLEGKNVLHLKDINGKPFIQSFLRGVSGKKRAGWAHYRWPRPGQSEPAWKSAYLVRVTAPSGKEYVVGSGVHSTRTERMFVVSTVEAAARLLQKEGAAAFQALRDPSRDFLYGDVYVFVIDSHGKELVNPASPELEGQNVMDLKDKTGKPIVREMFRLLRSRPSGWVDYQWPKPGATVPSRKSSYIRRVKMAGDTVLVGAGVYLN